MLLEDLSTREYFLFRVRCAVCTAPYGGRAKRFSRAGEEPLTEPQKLLFDALYDQEFRAARQGAIRSAAEHLNFCPVCKRLACNRCFLICDELDLCADCADRLGVSGSPVVSGLEAHAI